MLTAVMPDGQEGPWITEPGIYEMPAASYHADPVVGGSLSASGAKLLLPPNCPAIFDYHQRHPRPPKRAFDVGHAVHSEVLGIGEPIVVIDAPNYNTKKAQQERDAAYADGHVPVLAEEMERVRAMAVAVREHSQASALLDPALGHPERAMVWRDQLSGVWCRSLVDFLYDPAPGRPFVLVDLKTAEHVDPDAISRAIASYLYHSSADWYCDGARALGLCVGVPPFVLIFVRKAAPHLVVCAQVHPGDLLRGGQRNEKARDLYRWCRTTGRWPAYLGDTGNGPGYTDDHVISVQIPTWAAYQHDGAAERGEFLPEGLRL